jgi:hypothetical protein
MQPNPKRVEEIRELAQQGFNQKEIAAILGCTRANITFLSRKYRVAKWPIGRPPSSINNNNWQRLLAFRTVLRHGRNPRICEACSFHAKEDLHIHHKDKDRTNYDNSNLQVLCNSCHGKLHNSERERDSKGRFLT